MSDQIQNSEFSTGTNLLGYPFHLVRHCLALLSVLCTRPIVLLRNTIMGFFYIQSLGYGHTSSKVSSRLKSWMKIPGRTGCPVCSWIEESNQEFGPQESTNWLNQYRPSQSMLARFRAKLWPENTPRFTLLLVNNPTSREEYKETINRITNQTYDGWELICLFGTDGAAEETSENWNIVDPRIQFVRKESFHISMVGGTHFACVEAGDLLEPQALHRMAEVILTSDPDMLYSDEAIFEGNAKKIVQLVFRSAFSEDGFLSHPESYHLFVIRKKLLEQLDWRTILLDDCPSPALIFNGFISGSTISHLPEILYLRRESDRRPNDKKMGHLIRQYLASRGRKANVISKAPGLWNIAYEPSFEARVAIIIPTKNQGNLLKNCLDSIRRTVPEKLADVYVINHQSDEPETLELLKQLETREQVIDWNGIFNFSEMNNHAVSHLKQYYSHYLFLNNDTEAMEAGWLEHMVGLGSRDDVGIVGAVLIYPDGTVQHAGVAIGIYGGAGHLNRLVPFIGPDGKKLYEGRSGEIASTRDVSAVTGACLLIRSKLFEEIGRFDPTLEVGFGDIDLCHKVKQLGLKVLIDSDVVLYHYESLTRGMKMNPHPNDTRKYLARYADLIIKGDPYFHLAYRRDNSTPIPKVGLRAPELLSTANTVHLIHFRENTSSFTDVA